MRVYLRRTFVSLASLLLLACSGSSSKESDGACSSDDQCTNGQVCDLQPGSNSGQCVAPGGRGGSGQGGRAGSSSGGTAGGQATGGAAGNSSGGGGTGGSAGSSTGGGAGSGAAGAGGAGIGDCATAATNACTPSSIALVMDGAAIGIDMSATSCQAAPPDFPGEGIVMSLMGSTAVGSANNFLMDCSSHGTFNNNNQGGGIIYALFNDLPVMTDITMVITHSDTGQRMRVTFSLSEGPPATLENARVDFL